MVSIKEPGKGRRDTRLMGSCHTAFLNILFLKLITGLKRLQLPILHITMIKVIKKAKSR